MSNFFSMTGIQYKQYLKVIIYYNGAQTVPYSDTYDKEYNSAGSTRKRTCINCLSHNRKHKTIYYTKHTSSDIICLIYRSDYQEERDRWNDQYLQNTPMATYNLLTV